MLDYKLCKKNLRLNWPQVVHQGLWEDVFHDTWADYLEQHDDIPEGMNHFTWLNNRVWNNVNQYEPFKSKKFASKRKTEFTGSLLIYTDELENFDDELTGPEADVEKQQQLARHYQQKYPKQEGEHPLFEVLRQGYTLTQARQILGLKRDWAYKIFRTRKNKGQDDECMGT